MAVFLRDFFDADIQALLLEESGFISQDQWRKASPARDSDGYFGVLRLGWHTQGQRRCCGGTPAGKLAQGGEVEVDAVHAVLLGWFRMVEFIVPVLWAVPVGLMQD